MSLAVMLAPAPWSREAFTSRGSNLVHPDLFAQLPIAEFSLDKLHPTRVHPSCISSVSLLDFSPSLDGFVAPGGLPCLTHSPPSSRCQSGHLFCSLPIFTMLCSTIPVSELCTPTAKGP